MTVAENVLVAALYGHGTNVHFSLPMSHRAYVLEQGRVVLEGAGRAIVRRGRRRDATALTPGGSGDA